jgi:outer membrane protein assembly factor BamB
LNISFVYYSARAAPILVINVTTDKQAYNVGESVKITGNVTLDGVLQNNTLAAIEVDNPRGDPYVIRTVDTGNVSGQSWWIQITNLYTCNQQGVPQTTFYRGSDQCWFDLNVTNTHPSNTIHVVVGAYIQGSSNSPVGRAFYPSIGDDISPLHWVEYRQQFTIPSYAPTGGARLYINVFNTTVRNQGYALVPEQSVNFSIEASTPSMPVQPSHFNVTFKIPSGNLTAGNYSIFASTSMISQTATYTNDNAFTINGPVPVVTHLPNTPIVSQTVTFNGAASHSPYGTIVDWLWFFADGASDQGAIVTHAYKAAGNYPFTLALTDSIGVEFLATYSVTVLEAWPMFRHDFERSGSSASLSPVKNVTKWSKTIGPTSADTWMYSSPAVTPAIMGNAVFIGSTNGTVYAFNATDGQVFWNKLVSSGFKFFSSPAFAEGLLFIGADDNRVYALNTTNGNTQYSILTGGAVYSSPGISKDRVYVGSQDSKVYAFYLNGTSLWTSVALDGTITSSPAIANGRVYVSTSNGTLYALNEMTGTLNWTKNLAPGVPIHSSPALASGQLFVGSTDNRIYAINGANGNIIWNVTTGGGIYSSPAIVQGIVFIGSMDGNVYALNADSGAVVWISAVGQIKWAAPLIAEGKVFIGTTSGKLYALREENGEVWWTYQTGGAIDSSPAVLNDILYVSSKDGKLYAFNSQVHDVTVSNFIPSSTLVEHNYPATFLATLWNKGTFSENLSVKSYFNGTQFYSNSFVLARGGEQALAITLDTASLPIGNYVILVNASLTPPATDENAADNIKTCQIKIEYGDVSLTNVVPSTEGANPNMPIPMKTVVGRGFNSTIYVTVKNQGNFTENNVQIKVYWSNSTYANQTISTTIISSLAANSNTTIKFMWNTAGLAYGNYSISADAQTILGESNTANNRFVDGVVRIGVAGDITSSQPGIPDGIVDTRDTTYCILLFQTFPSSPNWKPNADINNDGIVNTRDITVTITNFRKTET